MIDGSTQVIIDKQDAQITAKPISTSIEVSASPEMTNQEVQNVPVYQDQEIIALPEVHEANS